MTQPQLLFITAAHPGGSGLIGAGEGVCASSLRRLVAEGYAVHVLCFASPRQFPNQDVVGLCASYQTFLHDAAQSVRGILGGWRWGSFVAPWFFTRASARNVRLVKQALVDHGNCRVWLDFAGCLGFVPHLIGAQVDYFAHDVVSQNVGRRPILSLLAGKVAAVEAHLIGCVRRCHVLSEKDKLLLVDLGLTGEVVVGTLPVQRPGRVASGEPVANVLKHLEEGCNLVFFGNMQRPENHWSMMHFIVFQFPLIRRAFPQARLWILGLEPRRSLRWLARMVVGVTVTGAVDDPMPALSAATLCIAPLRFGAGVKIKVLQMLDAGASVIATPIAGEGIVRNDRLMVVDGSGFVDAVCQFLAQAPNTKSDHVLGRVG